MGEERLEFENDGLYRIIPVYGHSNLIQKELVMSKEVFIMCYKKWIKGNPEVENAD